MKEQILKEILLKEYPAILLDKTYTLEELIYALLQDNANLALKHSRTVSNGYLKRIFFDKPSGSKLRYWILSKSSFKECKKCNSFKQRIEFRKNSSTSDGLNNHCSNCQSLATKVTQPARQANYRAGKEQRTPLWADLVKIKEIYDKCPEGYHVDHEVPLHGLNVCGLHVEHNLQYLTAVDNITKNNKF